jgi:hypothetical protein
MLDHVSSCLADQGAEITHTLPLCPARPLHSTAAQSRERVAAARTHDWRATASRALGAWHARVLVRAAEARAAGEIAAHRERHARAAAWRRWQAALEAACPQLPLLRSACARRGRAVRGRVLAAWRAWAPVARAKRRRERDKLAAMARWRRRRWGGGGGSLGPRRRGRSSDVSSPGPAAPWR